ncbi:MAG: hypothetical protein IPO51_06445 [Dehalococcoidia bacterium]|nr:hypothetical protein [Dehalococcoidia bacterium]
MIEVIWRFWDIRALEVLTVAAGPRHGNRLSGEERLARPIDDPARPQLRQPGRTELRVHTEVLRIVERTGQEHQRTGLTYTHLDGVAVPDEAPQVVGYSLGSGVDLDHAK